MNENRRVSRTVAALAVALATISTALVAAAPKATAATTFTWDGGGADTRWSTAANWVGDVVPTAGSTLVFPAGSPKATSIVDLGPAFAAAIDSQRSIATLQADGDSTLALQGLTATGRLSIVVPVVLTGSVAATSTTDTVTFIDVRGDGGLALDGSGRHFVDAATNTGETRVQATTLEVNQDASTSPIVLADGTLTLCGTTGPVSGTGHIAGSTGSTCAVTVAGNLDLAGGTVRAGKRITVTGDATLAATVFPSASLTPVLMVAGATTFDGAEIDLSDPVVIELDVERIPIIDGGATAVTGTFAGLPDGSPVRYGLGRWTIEYGDIDPGDVALVRDHTVESVWDGGSAGSGSWSDTSNWVGDVAPNPGDLLIFPAGAARLTNTNDFPPATAFDVRITGDGYVLDGSAIAPTAVAVHVPPGPSISAQLAMPLTLATDATIDVTTATLTLSGVISGAAGLSFTSRFANGIVRMLADNSYSGATSVDLVRLDVSGHQPTSAITLGSNGTMRLGDGATVGSVSNTGAGGGRLELSASATVDGDVALLSDGAAPSIDMTLDGPVFGTLRIEGDFAFGSRGSGPVEIAMDLGSGNDLIDVGGTFTAGSTAAHVAAGLRSAGPAGAAPYDLITAAAVAGVFTKNLTGHTITYPDGRTVRLVDPLTVYLDQVQVPEGGTGTSTGVDLTFRAGTMSPGDTITIGWTAALAPGTPADSGVTVAAIGSATFTGAFANGAFQAVVDDAVMIAGDEDDESDVEVVVTITSITSASGTLYANGCASCVPVVVLDDDPTTEPFLPDLTLPAGSVGQPYPDTPVEAQGGRRPYSYSATEVPPGLTFSVDGVISGTPTQVGAGNIAVTVTDALGGTAQRTYPVAVTGSTLGVAPGSMPPAETGIAFGPLPFAATGNTGDVGFVLTGSLPSGVSFDGHSIAGVPAEAGSFPFTVTATDAANQTGSRDYTMIVTGPPVLPDVDLPGGTVNEDLSVSIAATGGAGSNTYSISAGGLPPGLSLGADTGAITGTLAHSGMYAFSVLVVDALGGTDTNDYDISVAGGALAITGGQLPPAEQGARYDAPLSVDGVIGTAEFAVTAGALPPGLELRPEPRRTDQQPAAQQPAAQAPTGTAQAHIVGTPTGGGPSAFTITVTDAAGSQTTYSGEIVVATSVSVTTSDVPDGRVGVPYVAAITTAGGAPPVTISVVAGALPAGVSMSPDGQLRGTPTAAFTSTFTVRATSAAGGTAERTYSLAVAAASMPGDGVLPATGLSIAVLILFAFVLVLVGSAVRVVQGRRRLSTRS